MARRERIPEGDDKLNITSLMDIMTIVLVFLLKNIDMEGNAMNEGQKLKLPSSTSQKTLTTVTLVMEANPWDIRSNNKVLTELAIKEYKGTKTVPDMSDNSKKGKWKTVENNKLILVPGGLDNLKSASGKIRPFNMTDTIPGVFDSLNNWRQDDLERQEIENMGKSEEDKKNDPGRIVIQMDKNLHFRLALALISNCGLAGYEKVNLAVRQRRALAQEKEG